MTDVKTVQNVTKTFKYSFPTCTNEEVFFHLEVPVEVPHAGCTRELVQRVINMFHIPVYLEDELNEELAKFVAEETKSFHNERDENLINQLKSCELNSEGIVKNWEKLFKDNVLEFAEQKGTSDEEVFAAAYHKLVHSPALETILQVENSYAKTFDEVRKSRDEDIKQLTQQQTEEMEERIRQLNVSCSEADINALAAAQWEAQALANGRWGSQLDALWHTQRAQFRAWLMRTADRYQTTRELHTPSNSPLGTFSAAAGAAGAAPARPPGPAAAPLEESFTIHLGSQLKQTHNVRIAAADLLDRRALAGGDSDTEQSLRLQSSLSLYGSELSGAVLLCEAGPGPGPGPAPEAALAAAAARGVDHHFPARDAQCEHIAEAVAAPVEERNEQRLRSAAPGGSEGGPGGPAGGLPGGPAGGLPGGLPGGARARRAARGLQPGDVFVTRHSNLPDVHVVFHLVVDRSSLRSGDITSRHPAILGLRNILKAACANDVTNLTLPLLLTHELTEEMTAAWCARRAELVLKCVKGFMLEAGGWGGAELRTLSALLPARAQPALYRALAALLPAVFRLSNPVKLDHPPHRPDH